MRREEDPNDEPLFATRRQAWWWLLANVGSCLSLTAFFVVGPSDADGPVLYVPIACGMACLVAMNAFLSARTREMRLGRWWWAQVRLQQRLGSEGGWVELVTALGWDPLWWKWVRNGLYGPPIVAWAIGLVASLIQNASA